MRTQQKVRSMDLDDGREFNLGKKIGTEETGFFWYKNKLYSKASIVVWFH